MNQRGMTMEGDIIRIATLATLAQEEKLKQAQLKAAQAAKKQAEALEPLFTEYIPISYSNAKSEVLPHIEAILTEGRGKASVDERNNQLILTDTALKIQQAKQIVQKIDTVTPQVIIEARVVEASTDFSREIGFDWGTVTLGAIDIPGTSYEFGETSFTTNNIPANFADNEERDSSGNTTVRFKDIDLLLEVTPSVTPDNRIAMTIFVTKNELAQLTLQGPALSTNEVETEILVDDGDTIVIGGILKFQQESDEKDELLIFITPRIVQLEQKRL